MHMSPFELPRPDGCVLRGKTEATTAESRRGHFVLVHGLGEHMGRYDAMSEWLRARGFDVTRYDHRGHGTSDGPRGGLHADDDLLQDLRAVIARTTQADGAKPWLFGHSMGGLTCAVLITRYPDAVHAAVLSSPALAIWLNPLEKMLLATLPKFAPNLRVNNGLKDDKVSHDPTTVARYGADPQVHRKAAARLVAWMVREQAAVYVAAPALAVRTLMIWAEDDNLVNPKGSQMFAAAANPAMLTARQIGGAYHEIFNEAEPFRSHAFRNFAEWLAAQKR